LLNEFHDFLRILLIVEGALVCSSLILALLTFKVVFALSLAVGFLISGIDLFLLARFSKRVVLSYNDQRRKSSGLFPRLALIFALIVGIKTLFTELNLFAIIVAVILAEIGVFISYYVYRRKEWSTEAS
jgi:uncharacterized membrane protein